MRGLLGDAVAELRCEPRTFAMAFDGTPESLFELYRDCFGPVLQCRAAPASTAREPGCCGARTWRCLRQAARSHPDRNPAGAGKRR